MKLVPMLQVEDVQAASAWYQSALGLVSGHGGPDYEMLFGGTPHATPMLLQLHRWDAEEHGFDRPPAGAPGAGCSLWFEVPDRAALDAAWDRARGAGATVLAPPHHNALAHHHEFTLRDRDGYVVVLHSPFEP